MLICFPSLIQFVRAGCFTILITLTRGVTSAVIDAGKKREKLVYMQCCTAAPVQGTAYNNTTSAFGDLQGTVEAMSQSKISVLAHA